MSKIILIIPPSPWLISDTDLPFLGVLYISAYLKVRGIEVYVCDLSGLEQKDWKIPIGDYYGITGTSPNFPQIKQIAQILRNREPTCKIIAGGAHASTFPAHLLERTEVDICVIGEGEQTVLEIMRGYALKEIAGISYKDGQDIRTNRSRILIETLDNIPMPDLKAIDFYKYAKSQIFSYLLGECTEATMLTARGCPYNCAFCAQSDIWKHRVRMHSVWRMIQEVKTLQSNYGVDLIYFVDDTFVLDKTRLIKFCDEIEKIGIKWHCLNRVDRCDFDLIKKMRDAGCIQMVFGFESGSDIMLKRMNKRATIRDAYKAIEVCESLGIQIRGQMIVGFPGETDQTVEETAKFIKKASYVTAFGIHQFQPFPGCDVWKNPEKYNYFVDKDTEFQLYHTIGKRNFAPQDKQVREWFSYLKEVAGSRSIERKGS